LMMKTFQLLVLVLLACLALSACAQTCRQGTFDHVLSYGGRQRTYKVHVPNLQGNTSYPLVLVFHGLTQNGDVIEDSTGFSQLADQSRNFIVAYPDGVSDSWNAGSCCAPATTLNVDDYGFARALVSDIISRYCVARTRVYVTGYSNGCFMTLGLVCKAPDLFAGAACGSGGEILETNCDTDFNRYDTVLNVLEIHGTSDLTVPYNGNPLLGFPPVLQTYNEMATRMGCSSAQRTSFTRGRYSCVERYSCKNAKIVSQCTVDGGIHNWYDDNDFSNSEYILDFFGIRNYPLDKKEKFDEIDEKSE